MGPTEHGAVSDVCDALSAPVRERSENMGRRVRGGKASKQADSVMRLIEPDWARDQSVGCSIIQQISFRRLRCYMLKGSSPYFLPSFPHSLTQSFGGMLAWSGPNRFLRISRQLSAVFDCRQPQMTSV